MINWRVLFFLFHARLELLRVIASFKRDTQVFNCDEAENPYVERVRGRYPARDLAKALYPKWRASGLRDTLIWLRKL